MCWRITILIVLVSATAALGVEPASPPWIRSRSGQFLVQTWPPDTQPTLSTGAVSRLQLEPTPLAVSCERIKSSLLKELNWSDHWSGPISVVVRPHASPEEPIRMVAIRFIDGWRYQVELPPEVAEERFMRAMVEVLLRERANRRAALRSADVPLWLVEGLAAHLRSISLGQLLLGPDMREFGQRRRAGALLGVRPLFVTAPPLSLERLSWPSEADLSKTGAQFYEASAQVLTYELFRLPRGAESLGQMIDLLPAYLNWQTAFLGSFQGRFRDFTDFDKWWSLVCIHYYAHPDRIYWTEAQASRQLEEILTVPVEVRLSADQLPMRSRASLQKVILEWSYSRQQAILEEKLNHLQALLLRCHTQQAVLVRRYHDILNYYLHYRRGLVELLTRPGRSSVRSVAMATIHDLDQLDAERRAQELPAGAQARR